MEHIRYLNIMREVVKIIRRKYDADWSFYKEFMRQERQYMNASHPCVDPFSHWNKTRRHLRLDYAIGIAKQISKGAEL